MNCVFESQDVEFNLSEGKTPSTNDSDCALCHLGAEREHMLNHSESQASPTLFWPWFCWWDVKLKQLCCPWYRGKVSSRKSDDLEGLLCSWDNSVQPLVSSPEPRAGIKQENDKGGGWGDTAIASSVGVSAAFEHLLAPCLHQHNPVLCCCEKRAAPQPGDQPVELPQSCTALDMLENGY